jgi:hypothetical protein
MLHKITRKLGTHLIPIFCRILLLNPFMLYRGIPRHLLLAIRNDEVTSNGLPLLELPLLNKVFELPLWHCPLLKEVLPSIQAVF